MLHFGVVVLLAACTAASVPSVPLYNAAQKGLTIPAIGFGTGGTITVLARLNPCKQGTVVMPPHLMVLILSASMVAAIQVSKGEPNTMPTYHSRVRSC